MSVHIGNSPVSWGVDVDLHDGLPPWQQVFDEIAAAGYRWVELGARGYLPQEPGAAEAALEERGLRASGSYLLAPLHQSDRLDAVLEETRATCAPIADTKGGFLILVDWGSPVRQAAAGRSSAAPRQNTAERHAYHRTLVTVRDVARDEYGLTALVHPHAGTWLEFEDEVMALMEETDLDVCLDSGHFAYAGIDPVAFYRAHSARVPYLNFKDLDTERHSRCLSEELTFLQSVATGVFRPLGQGDVDFRSLAQALDDHGFDGHATVEQDRDPKDPRSAADDARASLEYLRSVGFSAAD